jgi:tetratricopeptide (TPR) repeat protein
MTRRTLFVGALAALAAGAAAGPSGERRFEWTTRSAEAKQDLAALQQRIESFQAGAETTAAARALVLKDPEFAMGVYYLSAVTPAPENEQHLQRAVLLAKKASDGERRFIEAMAVARANQGASLADAVPALEKLGADYPGERLVQVILGQVYQATGEPAKASAAFRRADAIGPKSPRVSAFLASDLLVAGDYAKARETFLAVLKALPKGSAPFAVRYGLAFSHLYEGQVDPALDALRTFLAEYRDSGAAQGFPEVFIWNTIARINLESGRLDAAMEAYEKGYLSVPGSSLPEDQKQVWKGRLQHGRCRVLARMGKHEEAWAEAQKLKKTIDDGGEAGKQYVPAWHYLAGYLELEAGDADGAIAELVQIEQRDPFQELLLARAYEKKGAAAEARKAWQAVVDSRQNSIERALAYPEAKRKLAG